MIPKLVAWWLVVLVLSPFTAPFSTCDFARPVRAKEHGVPFVPLVMVSATSDTNVALLPARAIKARLRLAARVGLSDVWESATPAVAARLADAGAAIQRHDALRSILRL